MERIRIRDLMETSGVKFGTSGARGLVTALTDRVAYAYTAGFLQHLERSGVLHGKTRVAFAGDRRSSTPRIKAAVARAIQDRGHEPVDCGKIPTPALALYGFDQKVPSVMVTGSHIPEDRNGIKFNTPTGEILKPDEVSIASQELELPALFDAAGALTTPRIEAGRVEESPERMYVARFTETFREGALEGLHVGVYGHSAVGREVVQRILESLGARVTPLGYSDTFVSVDTEAIRPEDVALARGWAQEHRLDSVVSTDGDSDRPLVSDERGRFLRGDVAGVLCARYLAATHVVTPVSSNTAVERSHAFQKVLRTRIGSPYVIEGMLSACAEGAQRVVGYEANGGFLNATPLSLPRGDLAPLPTRDAAIVFLTILADARAAGVPVSKLLDGLPQRFTSSGRLPDFPTERSQPKLQELRDGGLAAARSLFGEGLGEPRAIDVVDGVRIEFERGEIVHLRASGNAPELRCYTEADTEQRSEALVDLALGIMRAWR